MPALRLCGRKTFIAGDELRIYCLLVGFGRLIQLALASALTVFTLELKDYNSTLRPFLEGCDFNVGLETLYEYQEFFSLAYVAVSLAWPVVSLLTIIPMYILAGRGTPTDTAPRKHMPTFCYVSLSLGNTLRVACLTFGVFYIILPYEFCDCEIIDEQEMVSDRNDACSIQNTNFPVMAISIFFHYVDATIALISFVYLVCCRMMNFGLNSDSCWSTFCNLCMACSSAMTCCFFGGTKAIGGDFSDISILLANLFNDDDILDITPSDVAAGLIMVRRADKVEVIKKRSELGVSKLQLRVNGLDGSYRSEKSESDDRKPFASSSPADRTSFLSSVNKGLSIDAARTSVASMADQTSSVSFANKRISSISADRTSFISSADKHISMSSNSRRSIGNEFIGEPLVEDHYQDVYAIAEAARFYTYAAASYGWVAVMLLKPMTGTLKIIYYIFRYYTCFPSQDSKKYVSDKFLQLRRLAVRTVLDHLYEEDIIYATFKHSVQITPYFIALDHEWKSVVISIRGTMSMESLLADISLTPESLEEVGLECGFDGTHHYCHRGMLDCAKWIHGDLKRHGLLDKLLGPSGSHKEYELRIVGHSLGAGVSSVLSLMLRSQYQNLRCLAFASPGCVFDSELAKECSSWTTSFVVDCDFVARLSKESVEALRNDVLNMIARIKVPKHKVFDLRRLKKAKHNEQSLSKSNDDILFDEGELLLEATEFQKQLQEFYTFQKTLKQQNASKYIRLYIPGKVLHLQGVGKETTKENLDRSPRGQYANRETAPFDDPDDGKHTARWAARRDFDRIVLSSHLLWDHTPNVGIKSFQEVASKFGLQEPFFVERIIELEDIIDYDEGKTVEEEEDISESK